MVANAVVHLDEDSPHMHIVGVPVADGYKKGLSSNPYKKRSMADWQLKIDSNPKPVNIAFSRGGEPGLDI